MNEIVDNLIFLTILGSIGMVILVLVLRAKKQKMQKLMNEAGLRGWRYEPLQMGRVKGFRFFGVTDGISWSVEVSETTSSSESSSTSGSYSRTVWQTESGAMQSGLLLLGPRQAGGKIPIPQLGGLLESLIEKAMELMLGEDFDQFPGLHEVPVDEVLSKRYMIWAHDDTLARWLISVEVKTCLVNWQEKYPFYAKFNRRGLQLIVGDFRILDIQTLDTLVRLGVELVKARQSA
jgi:hypothetical protein